MGSISQWRKPVFDLLTLPVYRIYTDLTQCGTQGIDSNLQKVCAIYHLPLMYCTLRNEILEVWRREYTKKSGNRIVVSTRKNICKKSA